MPFVSCMFGIIKNAYNISFERVEYLTAKGISKPERVHRFIEGKLGKVTKKDIMEACPDISTTTIEKALGDLVKRGMITKICYRRGTGMSTSDEALSTSARAMQWAAKANGTEGPTCWLGKEKKYNGNQ